MILAARGERVGAAMMSSCTSRRSREHSGNADGRNRLQIRVQMVSGSEINDHRQARRTLKRPWRARGVPTPQAVRSSNPRFRAPARSSTLQDVVVTAQVNSSHPSGSVQAQREPRIVGTRCWIAARMVVNHHHAGRTRCETRGHEHVRYLFSAAKCGGHASGRPRCTSPPYIQRARVRRPTRLDSAHTARCQPSPHARACWLKVPPLISTCVAAG